MPETNTFEMKSATGRIFDVSRGKTIADNLSEGVTPLTSIIVPIYNAEYTLRQALRSIENQTLDNIEIVCVNDGSTDSSESIIDSRARLDGRYTIVTHRKNAGYGSAMNDGIRAASGAWIAILEPDDYIRDGMLSALLETARNAGDTIHNAVDNAPENMIDVVKSPYIREVRTIEGTPRGDGPYELLQCSYYKRVHPHSKAFNMSDPGVTHILRHHPSIWSAIYRKEFLEDKNISFVEYSGTGWADNEFFYETLLQANHIAYCKTAYYVYREETEEEFESFARKNKLLPFDRWHSMMDIIERIGITDDNIIRNHIAKGFTYLGGQIEANGWDDQEILDEAYKMFSRMDPMLVTDESKINPRLRKLYIDMMHADGMLSDKLRYKIGLAGEFFYTIRTNGFGYAKQRAKKFLENS